MLPHQERVVIEKQELDEKIVKLDIFTNSLTFKSLDEYERERLSGQLEYMNKYSSILGERITAFK